MERGAAEQNRFSDDVFYAHVSEDRNRYQTAAQHAWGTAQLAERFASVFDCGQWGYDVGLIHDIGKWTRGFQKRLHGGPKVDHSSAGTQELLKRKNYPAAYVVAGHHAGLPNGGTSANDADGATLIGRQKKKVEPYAAYEQEITFPEFPKRLEIRLLERRGFSVSFFIRMLFSCLVDADYLDTEAFMKDGQSRRGSGEPIEVLYEKLCRHIEPWRTNADCHTINGRRTMILNACMAAGREFAQGLYTLTVPTGGGKTTASLAFALEQARKHHLQRIIYVIPYTSIIEQNAQVFRDIVGNENVLEHHSGVSYDDPERSEELEYFQLASENWDLPVVVTTNVQFFESFFSNKPSRCRKLHNVAGSVVIFDEVQMLPVSYLKPCVRVIGELVANYHCTAVLCTATQPALGNFLPDGMKTREICPDPEEQFAFFRRTEVEMRGKISEESLIRELLGTEGEKPPRQILCILNSRKRAQHIYERLREECGEVYCLSTLMYPAHRKRVLKQVKEKLRARKTCILISTSLIEAGVDVDFGTVFRELAGQDSVTQAAGRCNREGKRNRQESRTIVFTLEKEEGFAVPRELALPIRAAQQVAETCEDFIGLEAVSEYFRRLYRYKADATDISNIVERFEEGMRTMHFPFADVGEDFHMIEERTKPVLIDTEEAAQGIAERIGYGEYSRALIRQAGMYSVDVFEKDFDAMMGAGLLREIAPGIYVLRDRSLYTEERGLSLKAKRGEAVFC
ncbi:MAG: CRISPR-associated helicase Cas3' [Eubacteriales bacterium]|nr:CRISPR-associated helicase Cas3' [Eubacteriales bacterium]